MAGLDADAKAFLDATNSPSQPQPTTPQEAQKLRERQEDQAGEGSESVGNVVNTEIPGRDGHVPVRIYYPISFKGQHLPGLIYIHGGCWMLGRLIGRDAWCRRLCNLANVIIMSVDYRKAPQDKFPRALQDCYAATHHAAVKGRDLGMDPTRLAVGGDSCGGNLAAAVAIMAKERGEPKINLQLLICPMTDHYLPGTESLRKYGEGYGYDSWLNQMGWSCYGACEAPHGSMEHPNTLAAVLQHPDVSGVAPAIVVLGQFDIVHDEGLKYAEKLRAAGVPVTLKDYSGVGHNFPVNAVSAEQKGMQIQKGKVALQDIVSALQKALS